MNLDFLKAKAPPLFGLDISSSSVKMLEIVDAGKGAYRVERYIIEALPKDAVVDGNINILEAVAVHRGIMIVSENRYFDLIQESVGRDTKWVSAFRTAWGLDSTSGQYQSRGTAALRLEMQRIMQEDAAVFRSGESLAAGVSGEGEPGRHRQPGIRHLRAEDPGIGDEAAPEFGGLLDEVERGETLIITRHGRRIARIVPEADRRQEEIDRSMANIRELRKRTGRITLSELLSARDEGRKA